RILLCAPVVLGPDVFQVGAVSKGVLGYDIDIATVEVRVGCRLTMFRQETVAENHVGRAKPAGISAPVQDGIFGHFRIERFAVRPCEGWSKHVMPEPISEQMVALLVVRPMRQN